MRESCEGAPIGLAAVPESFAVAQTGALNSCDGKRALAVTTVDIHNRYTVELALARERIDCLASKGWRFWRTC